MRTLGFSLLPVFVAALVAAIVGAIPAHAQKTKVYRVAYLSALTPLSDHKGPDPVSPAVRAFVHGLRDLGYVEGRNLVLDFHTLEGRLERIPEELAEIVRFKPDVIFTGTQIVAERHLQATAGIPIVTLATWSLVQPGVVQSLARPGGTVTGFIFEESKS